MPVTAFLGTPRAGGVLGCLARSSSAGASAGVRPPPLFAGRVARVMRSISTPGLRAWGGRDRHGLVRGLLESRIPRLSTVSLLARNFSSTPRRWSALPQPKPEEKPEPVQEKDGLIQLNESPYNLPNALTMVRIAACPILAWAIVKGQFDVATGILVASGLTDWLDGYLARKWNQKTVLGSVLDPLADKTLVTTLVVSLTYQGLLPLPLAVIIFGRDLGLSMWALYTHYKALPPPRTLKKCLDPTLSPAEIKPTQISKINTALQLILFGVTTVSPLLATAGHPIGIYLEGLQWIVAITTIWSGFSYLTAAGYKFLKKPIVRK